MAVSTIVSGPSSGAICCATAGSAGAFTATTTSCCTPNAFGSLLALTGTDTRDSPLTSVRPSRFSASSVAPRATTSSSQPACASFAPIQPPMAPAP